MSIINNGLLLAAGAAAAGGGGGDRSLRFNSADSAHLSRTPASAGNRKTWTWAGWVKRSSPGSRLTLIGTAAISNQWIRAGFEVDDRIYVIFDSSASGDNSQETVAVFRDASAWMHVVVAFDTTQATATDRVKIYVNGVLQATSNTYGAYAQNTDYPINAIGEHRIGSFADTGTIYYSNGYLADVHFIDGQALTPSSFAETNATTGQWVPKTYTGSYGTNGFRLTFGDNSGTTATTLGKDAAGSNNWTPNGFSVAAGAGNDSLVDHPVSSGTDTGAGGEVRGNYATWNPLQKSGTGSGTVSNGNLDYSSVSGDSTFVGTIAAASGKYYWEITVNTASNNSHSIGIHKQEDSSLIAYYSFDGKIYPAGTAYGNTYTAGDVIGVALDLDNGKVFFSKNGTWQNSGNPASGTNPAASSLTGTWAPRLQHGSGSGTSTSTANFGARAFSYQAPSGFKALCDTNLPTPAVAKPNTFFDINLSAATQATRTVSGFAFSPDLVISKNRTTSTNARWGFIDSVRGVNKTLASNLTDAEVTSQTDLLTAFNSDGFTLGADASAYGWNYNQGGNSQYVYYAFDAGTTTTTNTAGSITSSVRANASAGFSIVTYTGSNSTASTVGHGLGVIPGMVIVKNRTGTGYQWRVWHSYFGASTTKTLLLSATNGEITGSTDGYITGLTSTVFGFGGGTAAVNASSTDYVAYCFAPVAGYSAFGSYTGNGSADGPFVYTGFRPRWILLKSSSTTGSWCIYDTARNSYNLTNLGLYPNYSSAEGSETSNAIDVLSNGFKLRGAGGSDPALNGSGQTIVWAAFAESPFQYARAR